MNLSLMYGKICGGCKGTGRWGHRNGTCAACRGRGHSVDRANVTIETPEMEFLLNKLIVAYKITNVEEYKFHSLGYGGYDDFMMSVFVRFIRYGEVSEKVLAILRKSMKSDAEYAERQAERDAQKVEVVEGKRQIEGVISSTKYEFNRFAYNGEEILKIVVDCGGYRLYGTCPKSIADEENLVGKTVRFTATVKAKELGFGFYSRPKKAEVIAA